MTVKRDLDTKCYHCLCLIKYDNQISFQEHWKKNRCSKRIEYFDKALPNTVLEDSTSLPVDIGQEMENDTEQEDNDQVDQTGKNIRFLKL